MECLERGKREGEGGRGWGGGGGGGEEKEGGEMEGAYFNVTHFW